jgi:hypothetical protein
MFSVLSPANESGRFAQQRECAIFFTLWMNPDHWQGALDAKVVGSGLVECAASGERIR